MGYKNLGSYLSNYNVQIPDYLQQFLGDYKQSPYLGTMIGDLRKSSREDFGRGLGDIGGFFSSGGRFGSGAMRGEMGRAQDKWQRGLDSQVAGMKQGDLEGWRNRGLQAAGIQSASDQSARGDIAQGYSADQQRKAAAMAARIQKEIALIRDATARAGLAQQGRFGTWDRNFMQSKFDAEFPYWSLGQASSAMFPWLSGFGESSGYSMNPYQDPFGSMVGGGLGGAAMGYGMANPNGKTSTA